jgi:hypothetical protein
MIYPAFVLQQLISEKCGGKSFWKRLTKKREERFGTDYVPISLIFEKGGYLPDIKLSAENKRMYVLPTSRCASIIFQLIIMYYLF